MHCPLKPSVGIGSVGGSAGHVPINEPIWVIRFPNMKMDWNFLRSYRRQRDVIQDLGLFDISNDETVLSLLSSLNILPSWWQAGESGLCPWFKVAIIAEAQTGYLFSGWEGEGIMDSNATTTFVTMIKDRNLTAQFFLKPTRFLYQLRVDMYPEAGLFSIAKKPSLGNCGRCRR